MGSVNPKNKIMENFKFKELIVWQKSMAFTNECLNVAESVKGHYRLIEQLESASASIPQNIAEGQGRLSTKEIIHFFYIARGSLYETITLLNLFFYKNLIPKEKLDALENIGIEISKMILAFISQKRKYIKNWLPLCRPSGATVLPPLRGYRYQPTNLMAY